MPGRATQPLDARLNSRVTPLFRKRLARPTSPEVTTAEMRKLGKQRREDQHKRANEPAGPGVGRFDGQRVANWMKPYLEFARKNGVKIAFDGNFRPHGWKGDLPRTRTVFAVSTGKRGSAASSSPSVIGRMAVVPHGST